MARAVPRLNSSHKRCPKDSRTKRRNAVNDIQETTVTFHDVLGNGIVRVAALCNSLQNHDIR